MLSSWDWLTAAPDNRSIERRRGAEAPEKGPAKPKGKSRNGVEDLSLLESGEESRREKKGSRGRRETRRFRKSDARERIGFGHPVRV